MGRIFELPAPPADEVMRLVEPGAGHVEFSVKLKVVTPILGGGFRARTIDEVDVIRVPGIRGQLRYWWRALYARKYGSSEELYKAESALWGGVGKEVLRSSVNVSVHVERQGDVDRSDVRLYPGGGNPATEGAYALFPARAERAGAPVAPRRTPGTVFVLKLSLPDGDLEAVQKTLGAWILFGGVGGRTRRGLGALEPMDDVAKQLANLALFRLEASGKSSDVASLFGARMLGRGSATANSAWLEAIGWLRDFRQGVGTQDNTARESGEGKEDPRRPSQSRWPEADVMRRIYQVVRSHPPRYLGAYCYPRAQFGLPILGQWQTSARKRGERYVEPPNFEIKLEKAERLASPLIVKPVWVDGKWYALALWLNRALPNQPVGLKEGKGGLRAGSACRLADWPENALFRPLREHTNLQDAFFAWLTQTKGATVFP